MYFGGYDGDINALAYFLMGVGALAFGVPLLIAFIRLLNEKWLDPASTREAEDPGPSTTPSRHVTSPSRRAVPPGS